MVNIRWKYSKHLTLSNTASGLRLLGEWDTHLDPMGKARRDRLAEVPRSGFYAWLTRRPSQRARDDEKIGALVRAGFIASDRTYGARRVWRDVPADGISCGLQTDALVMAIWRRCKPDNMLHHSDQGSQYASRHCQELPADNGVTCSMSRSGNVWE